MKQSSEQSFYKKNQVHTSTLEGQGLRQFVVTRTARAELENDSCLEPGRIEIFDAAMTRKGAFVLRTEVRSEYDPTTIKTELFTNSDELLAAAPTDVAAELASGLQLEIEEV